MFQDAGFTAKQCQKVFRDWSDLAVWKGKDLRELGMTCNDALKADLDPKYLRKAGFTARELREQSGTNQVYSDHYNRKRASRDKRIMVGSAIATTKTSSPLVLKKIQAPVSRQESCCGPHRQRSCARAQVDREQPVHRGVYGAAGSEHRRLDEEEVANEFPSRICAATSM